MEIVLDEFFEVVFDIDLVLAGRDDDFIAVDDVVDDMSGVVEGAARSFGEADTIARRLGGFDYFFGGKGGLLEEV